MRQIRFLCAVLAVSVLSLTGCADIKNLSEEQENEIAEYAAGVLLQNSDKYPYRLITKEEKEITETPTPMPAMDALPTLTLTPPGRNSVPGRSAIVGPSPLARPARSLVFAPNAAAV